jgi:pimeloyl-ACP methyl ester carboxylesterase
MNTSRPTRSRRRFRLALLAGVVAGLLGALLAVPPAATQPRRTPPASTEPPVPSLHWADCGDGLDCATARVPLDYRQPRGAAVSLALIRLPAADPGRRIGSIFVNPGGPGRSGVDAIRKGGRSLFSAEVRARFDLIGLDPRGIIGSTPLRCFDTLEQAQAVLPPFEFPVTAAEERAWIQADRTFAAACARRGGPILDHMATADVARDLDLLRQAVGDERLTYAGASYGAYLGATYANLFPGRVRALVLDSAVDPVAWATGHGDQARTRPLFDRLGSARGTYATLVAHTFKALQDAAAWPGLAETLQQLDSLTSSATGAPAAPPAPPARAAAQQDYRNDLEGLPGVACSDSDNPDNVDAWKLAADAADHSAPYFGRYWTWLSSICQPWPGRDRDRYTGPWTRPTANPVLVVGNRFDPAAPYQGAAALARLLPRSRLLTLDGWGHTSEGKSSCVDAHINRYLLTIRVPPPGTVCRPDLVPFARPRRS